MTLQTNYKTMAHIKDQAQEYLDNAIKTWKGLACDFHGLHSQWLYHKQGSTVTRYYSIWEQKSTWCEQTQNRTNSGEVSRLAADLHRLTWQQQASELCHIGSISCTICLQNRSIWQSKLLERCQEDNVCIRRDQSGSFSVKLPQHCCDRNVMQIMYHQNRSVWQQQCQSIVTLAMSCSQYNWAALYW